MIWNQYRKWMGNLIPFLLGSASFCLILTLRNVLEALVAAVLVTHQSISQWGFFQNSRIDNELRSITKTEGELVGFVWDQPPSPLDAHAEIGLLTISNRDLQIITEDRKVSVNKSDVMSVSRSWNIHAMIGLGGWICLTLNNGPQLKIESREHRTMWKSKMRTSELFKEMFRWKQEEATSDNRQM